MSPSIMSWLKPRALAVEPLLFAFMPTVQLDLVVGELNQFSSEERVKIHGLAANLIEEGKRTSTTVGLASRIGRGEVVLVCVPVGAIELDSKRSGLWVLIGGVATTFNRTPVSMLLQLISALELVMRSSCQVSGAGLLRSIEDAARQLQLDNGSAVYANLRANSSSLADLFTLLIAGQHRNRIMLGSRRPEEANGVTWNNVSDEPILILAKMLIEQLRRRGEDQLAHHVVLGTSLPRSLRPLGRGVTAHIFRDNQLFICQSASVPDASVLIE